MQVTISSILTQFQYIFILTSWSIYFTQSNMISPNLSIIVDFCFLCLMSLILSILSFLFSYLRCIHYFFFFFFNDTPPPEISPLPLPDPLPILDTGGNQGRLTPSKPQLRMNWLKKT